MLFPVTCPLLLGQREQGQRPPVAPGQQSALVLGTLGSTGPQSRPTQQFGVTLTHLCFASPAGAPQRGPGLPPLPLAPFFQLWGALREPLRPLGSF